MAEMTKEEYAAACARGQARMMGPRAESVHYDAGRSRLIVRLTTGIEIGLPPASIENLRGASIADLKTAEVDAMGLGIHFPGLDADLYVPALLEGVLGSRRWMAAQLGAKGGLARNSAKAAASRRNGQKGGRPRKTTSAA